MSTETSEEFAALALELLGEEGVAVSIVASNLGAMTPSGDRSTPAPPRSTVGIIFPSKGTALVDGTEKASERVIIAPVDPWPTPGERVVINGRTLIVADDGVKTYAPQGLAIVHDLAVAS